MSFFLIVFSILGLIYGYTGWRFIAPLRLSWLGNLAAGSGILALLLLPWLIFRLRSENLPAWLLDLLAWIAYLGLGFFLLAFSLLLARDLVWLAALGLGKILTAIDPPAEPAPLAPERRIFLLQVTNWGIFGLTAALSGYGVRVARHRLQVIEVAIPIDGLPAPFDGFRIAQLSDLHVGLTIGRDLVQRAVDQVMALAPDLIVFTGDLVDGEIEQLQSHLAPLRGLQAPHGSFFITGNHEYYNSDPEGWLEEIRRLGFVVLLNEHRLLERQGEHLVLAGVTDFQAGEILPSHTSDVEKALADAPPGLVRILLAHQPRSIFAAAQAGCHLQLSGHTHGGQFVPWKYFVPLQQPFIAGLHRLQETWIYVNRGAGYWGPPLRLGVPAEITLLTLHSIRAPSAEVQLKTGASAASSG